MRDAEQSVEQAAVADVDLGRLDLAFAEVLEPRRQLPHHEHAGHQVEVAAHGGFVDRQRAGQFGGVPHLAVIVRDHVPEAAQRQGGNGHAQLRQVAFEKRLEKLPPPRERIRFGARGEGQGESAAQPVPGLRGRAQVGQPEAFERDVSSRPARVSDDCLSRSGEALPRMRNRAGSGWRSASTRSSGKRSGRRWISSMTTRPLSGRNAVSGSVEAGEARRVFRVEVVERIRRRRTARASVVLPHWRGPSSATTRRRPARCAVRAELSLAVDHGPEPTMASRITYRIFMVNHGRCPSPRVAGPGSAPRQRCRRCAAHGAGVPPGTAAVATA